MRLDERHSVGVGLLQLSLVATARAVGGGRTVRIEHGGLASAAPECGCPGVESSGSTWRSSPSGNL